MQWLIPLAVLVAFEMIADIASKEWSLDTRKWWLAAAALLAYLLANTSWLIALKNGSGLARGAVLFSVASAVLATLIGLVLYKENVTHIQLTGMVLGIVAILLIFWE